MPRETPYQIIVVFDLVLVGGGAPFRAFKQPDCGITQCK